jgi:hypothetical protein
MRSCSHCQTLNNDAEALCVYCGAAVPPAPRSFGKSFIDFLCLNTKRFEARALYRAFFIAFITALVGLIAFFQLTSPAEFSFKEKSDAVMGRLNGAITDEKLLAPSNSLDVVFDEGKLSELGKRYNNSIDEKSYYFGENGVSKRFGGFDQAMDRLKNAPSFFLERMAGYYERAKERLGSLSSRLFH